MKDDHDHNRNHDHGDDRGHGAHHDHEHGLDPKPHPNGPALFVDHVPYDWDKKTITGEQLRVLASLPDDVQIFHKIPGRPDDEIKDNTTVDLTKVHGPDHFWTQPVGSQAG